MKSGVLLDALISTSSPAVDTQMPPPAFVTLSRPVRRRATRIRFAWMCGMRMAGAHSLHGACFRTTKTRIPFPGKLSCSGCWEIAHDG